MVLVLEEMLCQLHYSNVESLMSLLTSQAKIRTSYPQALEVYIHHFDAFEQSDCSKNNA